MVGVKSTRINENANDECQVYYESTKMLMMDAKNTGIHENANDGGQVYKNPREC